MRHYYLKEDCSGDHYAVSTNAFKKEILIQLQENGTQTRISLSIEQAEHIIELLKENINNIKY